MSDEHRQKVDEIVSNADVTVTVHARGEAVRHEDWKCDAWEFVLGRGDRTERFDFYTGIGLRAEPTARDKQIAALGLPGITTNDIDRRTIYGRRYLDALEKLRKPVAPHVADLLYSVILDGDADTTPFADWCSNFGYNEDSRKALETYLACQGGTRKLRRIFSHEQVEALRTALEGY